MKNLITTLLVAIGFSAVAQTNLILLDTSAPHTNAVWSTGRLTVSGSFTNQTYTSTNSAYISYGDSAATAYGVINNNFLYQSAQILSNKLTLDSLPWTSNGFVGGVTFTNGTMVARRAEATNFWLSQPRWVDALAGGLTLAGGTAAPEKADLPGGNWTTAGQGYRYGHDDYASFAIQAWHVMASTNATFPALYYEPHIHVSVADISAGTNATFVLNWQESIVGGDYSSTPYLRTNTVGFTATNRHTIISFGEITNNALNARASVLFRGTVRRIASASNDVGSGVAPNQSRKVFVDSLDFHIPVRVLGSASQYTDE